jgi:pimeloyl-ACP methyl ester carboxylesterase
MTGSSPASPDGGPSRYEFSTNTVTFSSAGTRCVGDLYRPDRPADPPVVVLAGVAGGTREFGLPAVAERLAERGFAAFAFDYRTHGDSEGEPRWLVSPDRHRDDWLAALGTVRGLDGVDGRRVALWGVSLSGGLALAAAAEDGRVDAVVARVPVVDGRASALAGGPPSLARAVAAGVRDRVGAVVGRPSLVPVVAEADETALVAAPGARDSYLSMVPPDDDWPNEAPARALLALPRFRPAAVADQVRCPTLLVAGADDEVAPPDATAALADNLHEATLVRLPAGHFDVVAGRASDRALAHELAFLEAELGGASSGCDPRRQKRSVIPHDSRRYGR